METISYYGRGHVKNTMTVYNSRPECVHLIAGGSINRIRKMAAVLSRYFDKHFFGAGMVVVKRDNALCLGITGGFDSETRNRWANMAYGIFLAKRIC